MMITTREDEAEFAGALLELAKSGDISPEKGVTMFREEFGCSLTYCIGIGLLVALKKAAGVIEQR